MISLTKILQDLQVGNMSLVLDVLFLILLGYSWDNTSKGAFWGLLTKYYDCILLLQDNLVVIHYCIVVTRLQRHGYGLHRILASNL